MSVRDSFLQFKGVFKMAIKDAIAYKFEFVIWMIAHPIWLAALYFVWKAIYAYSGVDVIRGFTFLGFINYMILATIVGTATWVGVDYRTADEVRRGTLIRYIVKPVSYYRNALYSNIGWRFFAFSFESLPIVIFAIFFLGLTTTNIYFVLFTISVILAFVLNYTFTFIFGLMAFWLVKIGGIIRVRNGLEVLLKGFVMPISFFPIWFQKVSNILPFQYVVYVPAQIFLQNFTLLQSVVSIVIQLLWIVVLLTVAKIIWRRGYIRFAGVGM